MDQVDAQRFATTLTSIKDLDLEGLWAPMNIRDEKRVQQWKDWLEGNADMPTSPERQEKHVSDMTEGDLPELDDALDILDDMGFLD